MTAVIIGAGQCGVTAADQLRKLGFEGRILIIGEEPDLPYHRPPLSKQALSGETTLDQLAIRDKSYFDTKAMELLLGVTVTRIDPANRIVELSNGTTERYETLLLATGARPRPLNIPGRDLQNIFDLRTVNDVRSLLPKLHKAHRIAVIGGGFIGLEVAATARKLGCEVTVLEAQDRLMPRVFPPVMSAWFRDLHKDHGVNVITGCQVSGFQGNNEVECVVSDAQSIPVELVVLGIGVVPNVELAESAGLECEDGILVDLHCKTSAEKIFAAGDCARHPSPIYNRSMRLESVQNATVQARVAAHSMLSMEDLPNEIPWFWSDQYDVKLQMVGLSEGHDEFIIRGDQRNGNFTVLYLRNQHVIAADCVNNPLEFVQCRKGIDVTRKIDVNRLGNSDISLKEVLSGR